MRSPIRQLLAEARALGMLRGLAFDGLAMALVFAALAGLWIITTPASLGSAHPARAAEDNALATGGGE